jgi:hypothetical protein
VHVSVDNIQRIRLSFVEIGDRDLICVFDHGSRRVQGSMKPELLSIWVVRWWRHRLLKALWMHE